MREILFKAKGQTSGKWYEGLLTRIDQDACWIKDRYRVEWICDPDTICQYTGLTDKNGKKIWENDIISNEWCFMCGNSVVRFGEYKDFHITEKYQCGNLGFFLDHVDYKDSRCIRKDMVYFAGKCEVVGNVFDNPELLEGGD